MSQCQEGNKLKCHEWRCQGTKRHFRKPEHTKKHIKKDSIKQVFCRKILKILNLSQIYGLKTFERVEFSIDKIRDKYVKNSGLLT